MHCFSHYSGFWPYYSYTPNQILHLLIQTRTYARDPVTTLPINYPTSWVQGCWCCLIRRCNWMLVQPLPSADSLVQPSYGLDLLYRISLHVVPDSPHFRFTSGNSYISLVLHLRTLPQGFAFNSWPPVGLQMLKITDFCPQPYLNRRPSLWGLAA